MKNATSVLWAGRHEMRGDSFLYVRTLVYNFPYFEFFVDITVEYTCKTTDIKNTQIIKPKRHI